MPALSISKMFPATTKMHGTLNLTTIRTFIGRNLKALDRWSDGFHMRGHFPALLNLGKDGIPSIPYEAEKKKSSQVYLVNGHIWWTNKPDIGQMFIKVKERAEVKLLWEFIMLDAWQKLLQKYSENAESKIGSPEPIKVEDNRKGNGYNMLFMTFCPGLIVSQLSRTMPTHDVAHVDQTMISIYLSIAYHLGRLAHIKDSEELLHGDYALRHLIFDREPKVSSRLVPATDGKTRTWVPIPSSAVLSPILWVIDLENSTQAAKKDVQEENDKLLSDFRKIVKKRRNIRELDQFYRDGYNSLNGINPLLGAVKEDQMTRLGFSMDHLF